MTDISNPEVSQAFYSELSNSPAIYRIASNASFALYANLVIPDIPGANTAMSLEAYREENGTNTTLADMDGSSINWTKFYEEFGGDNYLQGPIYKSIVGPGTYYIVVHSDDNTGKYSLAIGEKEEFPMNEAINSIVLMPSIKAFFGKPFYAVFEGRIYQGLLVVVLIVIAVIWLLLRRKR
jgi:hypothetical protein